MGNKKKAVKALSSNKALSGPSNNLQQTSRMENTGGPLQSSTSKQRKSTKKHKSIKLTS